MIDLGDCREQQHLRELEAEMTGRGWIRGVNALSEITYSHPSGKWQVSLTGEWDGYWAVLAALPGRWPDLWPSPEGIFRVIAEGESLKELQEALSSTGQERK